MSILSAPHFHNEAAARERLETLVWPKGAYCPRCGGFDRITLVKGGRPGLRRCGPCKREFTVTVRTVFERSKVPLHKWFQAAHLLASSKKGISAHQLHRTLRVTYKTAWFMEHRLREAMRVLKMVPMGGNGSVVEADETYVGGKEKNRHRSKRTGEVGSGGKETVLSLVERRGQVRSFHVASVTQANLRTVLTAQLHPETSVMTDEAGQYRRMGEVFNHQTVNHSIGEYVRGAAHTNTIEGYFSILKRGIMGIYHHVSPHHLKRYLAEFDFRYNERAALGVDDEARADSLLRGIVGKRLLYKDSSPASI